MLHSLRLPPSERTDPAGQPAGQDVCAPKTGSGRDRRLAAEARAVLRQVRELVGADACSLLIRDETGEKLRVRWSVPAAKRQGRVHPVGGDCVVGEAMRHDRTAWRAGLGPTDAAAGCVACRALFGADASLAVPVMIGPGASAVVVAFGQAGRRPRRALRDAERLAAHLGLFFTALGAVRQAEWRDSALAAVNAVAANLTSVVDPSILFPKILEEIICVVGSETGALYLYDPEERRLRVVARAGNNHAADPDADRLIEQTAWERLPGMVFRSREAVVSDDIWRDQPLRRVLRRYPAWSGQRSAIGVPIMFRGEPLGVIVLASTARGAFTEQDRDLVAVLASHAAIAIVNARLYGEIDVRLQTRIRDLTILSEIGRGIVASLQTETVLRQVARGTAEAFGASDAVILLREGERGIVVASHGPTQFEVGRRVRLDESPAGWVAAHGQRLFIPSITRFDVSQLNSRQPRAFRRWFEREQVGSFIGVPLVIDGATFGSLGVYSRRGQELGATDVDLLEGLAAQAAIAIEKAHLYESVTTEKGKLEAIVESLRDGLALVDEAGTVAYANGELGRQLGRMGAVSPPSTIGELWETLSAVAQDPTGTRAALDALASGASQMATLLLSHPRQSVLEIHGFGARLEGARPVGRGFLVRDITEQAETERLKSSILTTVSHELRSPLTAIKGLASSLLRTDVRWDEADQRDFLERIEGETDRLSVLVGDLLDMSRIESGTLQLDREWCDLVNLVETAIVRSEPASAGRVRLVERRGRIVAAIDRVHIERVMANLIENALKYSPSGSPVTVGVDGSDEYIVITVADQGRGILPEERERVFDRFYRTTAVRSIPGVGLGLAICRGIVEAHSGSISVESEYGNGSVFTVRLPREGEGVIG